MTTYKVIRFYRIPGDHGYRGKREVVKTGLTLEEAQIYCPDDKDNPKWLEAYTEEL